MNSPTPERTATEYVAKNLLEQGYEVVREPTPEVVPEFLGKYRPDLIAFKAGSPSLVIEIKRRKAYANIKLADIRRLFKGHDDWEFRVVWVDLVSPEVISLPSATAMRDRSKELSKLFNAELFGPALLICWAMLEGVARANFPVRLQKPQAPKSVVQTLEAEGLIDDLEAANLRVLADKRNRLIHGRLEEDIEKSDILMFRDIISRLIGEYIATVEGT